MLGFIKRIIKDLTEPPSTPIKSSQTQDSENVVYSKTMNNLWEVDQNELAPKNKWYRRGSWKSKHYFRYDSTWSSDWKVFESEAKVVGVTQDKRTIDFLELYDQPNFIIFLERDKLNQHDENAIKVMGAALTNQEKVVKQLGFISKHTALQLKDEKDLDARPYSVYLPTPGKGFGLKIRILVRSHQYRKKHYGSDSPSIPHKFNPEYTPSEKDYKNKALVNGYPPSEYADSHRHDLDIMIKCCEACLYDCKKDNTPPGSVYFERVAILSRKEKNYKQEIDYCKKYIKSVDNFFIKKHGYTIGNVPEDNKFKATMVKRLARAEELYAKSQK